MQQTCPSKKMYQNGATMLLRKTLKSLHCCAWFQSAMKTIYWNIQTALVITTIYKSFFCINQGKKILQHIGSQLSDLSNAWSSNLPDCLTALALIQSNNGVANWGPNHATKHTVELLNQTGSSQSYITLIMVWNPGWLQICPTWTPSAYHVLISALQASSPYR